MKILLAYISGESHRDDPYINLVPAGLGYLHATLRKAGFDAILANFSGWNDAAISREIRKFQPEIVAISQWTHNRVASSALARLARRAQQKCLIVMGGAHATFRCNELLIKEPVVDAVILGEGEETLLELAERVAGHSDWLDVKGLAYLSAGSVVITPSRPPLRDLDQLPFPAFYLHEHSLGIDQNLQAEFVISARGCPSACSFCSSPGFWNRKIRFRSPQNVVDEILFLKDTFGLIYFSIRDDTFTADRRRTIEICRLLIERRAHVIWNCQSRVTALDEEILVWMKRAGCECVQLGVESGSSRILQMLDKTITPAQVEHAARLVKHAGINLSVYLISDVPGETEEDISLTIRLMRRIRPDDGYVSPLAYFPGTRLFDNAVAEGRVAPDLFEVSGEPALYAVAHRGTASRRLLKSMGHGKSDARDYAEIKRRIGFCPVTNVMAGEFSRLQGNNSAAEKEFREIVEREPDNPWGWFLLGELYGEQGDRSRSRSCYQKVLALVPNHQPSLKALQDKKKRGQ
ncbi:B12-binding domain-containing radical SAM protein [Pelotalea chapellei]|uniref:Cobalamin-dependent protein n=1 Tax=Pelotalea chapellei TaxID=44671 RepID=A0ABS5UAC0_9BACT|nr:radical SAM protein [Pelotalea chapellei]MBT1072633.1 cobalamin-dependent protein [Pelotalea chapellei]